MPQSHSQPEETEAAGTFYRPPDHPLEDTESGRRLPTIVYTLLLLVGLLALGATALSISNYTRSVEGVSGLLLEIADLKVIDDGNPRVQLHFRLHNRAPMLWGIERYNFTLYANGERVGGSSSTYRGTDPTVSQGEYAEATTIEQVLPADEHIDLDFKLYVYYIQMDIVRRALADGPISWSVDAGFHVKSPYSRVIEPIGLDATFEE